MDAQHDQETEQTDTDHALLTVIPAVILDKHQRLFKSAVHGPCFADLFGGLAE